MARRISPLVTHESPCISVIKGYPTEKEFQRDSRKACLKKKEPKKLVRKHSDVPGVDWIMNRQKWRVTIRWQGNVQYLGYFNDEWDAKDVARKFLLTHSKSNPSLVVAHFRPRKGATSKFKGVTKSSLVKYKYYVALIQKDGNRRYLGKFPYTPAGEIQAARAYDKAALELFGEHAWTNEMEYGEYWK